MLDERALSGTESPTTNSAALPKRVTTTGQTKTALQRIAEQADEHIDLGEAALLFAALDSPTSDVSFYRDHLTAIADMVGDYATQKDFGDTPAPEQMADALNESLVRHFHYAGDDETYDDLDNANLMRVIDRRRGLPVALGILYLTAARAQGWAVAGLNFPGHFLIRIESRDGRRIIVDPFHEGRIMDAPALRELLKIVAGSGVELEATHYRTVSNRDVLIRLQNNVKTRRLDKGLFKDAVDAVENMLLLAPESLSLWREAGVLHMRTGHLKRAIESFEKFVSFAQDGPDRTKIAKVIHELRERIN
ncbi:MAG: transglutaminase family protein [Rhodospirillaceae bacterium]|nr:transglutaminase family protein [Rhodospirillaceae bacterium]